VEDAPVVKDDEVALVHARLVLEMGAPDLCIKGSHRVEQRLGAPGRKGRLEGRAPVDVPQGFGRLVRSERWRDELYDRVAKLVVMRIIEVLIRDRRPGE